MSAQGSVKRDDSGRWFFVVDGVSASNGRRKQMRRRGFATKKDAQQELTKLLGEFQRGTFVPPRRTRVGEYLETWLAGLPASGRRPSTIAGYRHLLAVNVIPTLGGIELQALRATDLDALYARLLGRRPGRNTREPERPGLSMSSVRKVHVVLGKALSDAERKGLIARNVARLATPPAHSAAKPPEMHYWTPAQLRLFLDGIAEHHHYPMFRLAAMTGLRRGELCGLRWTDVDLDAGTVAVRQAVTCVEGRPLLGDVKTKRSRRTVDIDPTTVHVLRSWRKTQLAQRLLLGSGWLDTGLLFTSLDGAGWHPDTISQAFERLVMPSRRMTETERSSRPPRIRFHDLRHTHASQLLAAGVNVKVVSDRLGHASVAFTLDTYAHVMPGQQASAAAAVSALVDAL